MQHNRRHWLTKIGLAFTGIGLLQFKGLASPNNTNESILPEHLPQHLKEQTDLMKLGAFSVSLNVKDLNASKLFYENLGFKSFGGDIKLNYLIMNNDQAIIGIFQGMFEKNILTFNPGWDDNAKKIEQFDDVRIIQKRLKEKGIKLMLEADEKTTGPASIMIADPDGNLILFDQHV